MKVVLDGKEISFEPRWFSVNGGNIYFISPQKKKKMRVSGKIQKMHFMKTQNPEKLLVIVRS